MNGQAKLMTYGEGGLATTFIVLAFVSVIVAAKAYTPAYAFHAYLFAAASAAAAFAVFNHFFARGAEPIPLTIAGKPNYNMGPVKVATLLAVFWGVAGICAMNILIYLVPMALLLGLTGLLDNAALRILPDDDVDRE